MIIIRLMHILCLRLMAICFFLSWAAIIIYLLRSQL
jgi:hypothetical protein